LRRKGGQKCVINRGKRRKSFLLPATRGGEKKGNAHQRGKRSNPDRKDGVLLFFGEERKEKVLGLEEKEGHRSGEGKPSFSTVEW